MSSIKVVSTTQRIVVDPAQRTVSVVNAGPIGPRGQTGPSEAGAALTTDGDILTRESGVPARINRATLANDTAFSSVYVTRSALTADGQIMTRAGGNITAVSRASLATDTAFSSRYAKQTQGAGAPAGTGTQGDLYWDTTNKRLYLSDGVGWIIMQEPWQTTWTPSLASTGTAPNMGTVGALQEGQFKRHGGLIDFAGYLAFGTGATPGTGTYRINGPKALKGGSRRISSPGTGIVNGAFSAYRSSTAAFYTSARFYVDTTGTSALQVSLGDNAAIQLLGAAAPWAWASGDGLEFFITGAEMNTPYL